MPQFDKDRKEVIERAKSAGIDLIITIGVKEEETRKAIELSESYEFIYATAGMHPHEAKDFNNRSYTELKKLSNHSKVVAIGEIGLDFYRNLSPHKVQEQVFRNMISLGREEKLPLIIHSRGAHNITLNILNEEKAWENGGIFHCFSGDINLAKELIDKGFLISIPGTVTYKRAETLIKVVGFVPLEFLAIETDAPFLSPIPFRGKRNEPAYVTYTARKIAEIKGITKEEVGRVTSKNVKELFNIKS
jgi:TatD DNase family protein